MTIIALRAALFVGGLLVWGYGVRVADKTLTLAGILLLALSLLLRFAARRRRPAAPDDERA